MPATANPLKADPSRTSALQRRYVADLNRRFAALGRDVRQLVDAEDAFGLRSALTRNTRWAFDTNDGKMRSFRGWLRYQTAQGILGTDAADPARPWTADYVDSAFLRGVDRAAIDATRGSRQDQDRERDRMRTRMTTGAQSMERLRMLYLRSFEDLQGVTQHMSVQMSKILASGLLHGLNPREIARQLVQQVGLSRGRAETIARTELISVHAQAQLDTFAALGIGEVSTKAEFMTAGDFRVCTRCAALEGRIFTLRQAQGVIPVHPRCRCVWGPVLD